MSFWHKNHNENRFQQTNQTEIQKQSASSNEAQENVGRLDCDEDHEEVEGDHEGVDQGLQIRSEPFS